MTDTDGASTLETMVNLFEQTVIRCAWGDHKVEGGGTKRCENNPSCGLFYCGEHLQAHECPAMPE